MRNRESAPGCCMGSAGCFPQQCRWRSCPGDPHLEEARWAAIRVQAPGMLYTCSCNLATYFIPSQPQLTRALLDGGLGDAI